MKTVRNMWSLQIVQTNGRIPCPWHTLVQYKYFGSLSIKSNVIGYCKKSDCIFNIKRGSKIVSYFALGHKIYITSR